MKKSQVSCVKHIEIDSFGVVHFSHFVSWMETACLNMLENMGIGLSFISKNECELRVINVNISYKSSAFYKDTVFHSLNLKKCGETFFILSVKTFRLNHDNSRDLLSEGELNFVFFDANKSKITKMPDEFKYIIKGINNE